MDLFLRHDIPLPLDTLDGKTTGLLIVPWFVLGERTRRPWFKITVGSFQTQYRTLCCHWLGPSLSPFLFLFVPSTECRNMCSPCAVITILTSYGSRWWPAGESLRRKLLPLPSFGSTAKLLPRGQSENKHTPVQIFSVTILIRVWSLQVSCTSTSSLSLCIINNGVRVFEMKPGLESNQRDSDFSPFYGCSEQVNRSVSTSSRICGLITEYYSTIR